MKANFKKQVNALLEQIGNVIAEAEALKDDFENWKDDHEYEWEDTPVGQRAESEFYQIESCYDTLTQAYEELEESLNQEL